MKLLRPSLLALACLCASPAPAYELPSLGDSSSAISSPEREYELGRAWLNILRGQVPTLTDSLLTDYIETSVYRLAETSEVVDRRFSFVVLDSPQINAFAAPGGIIGVNAGLFLHADTEAEYASVMAHELAHLSQRHYARGLESQGQMQLPVMAGILAGVVAAAAGAGQVGMAAIASTQAAAIQAQRRYSRQNEQEADRIGLANLQRAGYDPRAMPSMFEQLMKNYRYTDLPPEFLLTHPLSDSRVADTRNRAEKAPAGGKLDSLRYQLMRARVELNYENTPGEAARRFRILLRQQPELIPARYGLALALARSAHHDEASRELAPLLQAMPDDPVYNYSAIEIAIAANQLDEAGQRLQRMLRLYPSSYPLHYLHARLLRAQEQPRQAEQVLDRLLQQRPADSVLWYMQAETRGLAGNIIGLHEARAEYFRLVGDYDHALEQLEYARSRASSDYQLAARIDARHQQMRRERRMIDSMLN